MDLDLWQLDQLERFGALLASVATDHGLIATADRDHVLHRHVIDCLRAVPLIDPAARCFDLGSGAGLPGVVVAIAARDVNVGLIESRRRRIAFLEFVVGSLGLPNAEILPMRIEEVHRRADVCLARALAPASLSWELAAPLLRPGGALIYFAGARWRARAEAPRGVGLELIPSPLLESAGPLVIMTRQ